jgi:hypothetical protein
VTLPNPSQPESAVIRALYEYRAAMDSMDYDLMQEMGRKWLEIERKLDGDITALAYEMERRQHMGENVTQQMIWKAERYQVLKGRMQDEIAKYNKNYAVGAISDAQSRFATLGISAANDAILASYPGAGALSTSWNRINVEAVQAMIGFAGDGSPLSKLLRNDYGDAADGLMQALINGLARGYGPAKIGQDMADGMGMGLDRALLISRTEAARAYRTGSTEQYRKSGVVSGFMRLVKKSTACAGCLMLDGEKFETKEELYDHPRGKAELPDNLIMASDPQAFVTLRHEGDIVIISTASGKFLPVTSYHPVLTDRGWIAAKFIKKGDNVIGYSGSDWASMGSPNKNHVPARAQDIAGAFNMFRLGSVPESAKHLYDNREDGQIDIIYINRLLWDGFNTALQKQVKEYLFGNGIIRTRLLDSQRLLYEKFMALFDPALRVLCGLDSGFAFCSAHSGITQDASGGRSAMFNPRFSQQAGDDIAGYPELFGDGLLGFSIPVKNKDGGASIIPKDDFIVSPGSGHFCGLDFLSFGFAPKQSLSLEQIRKGLRSGMPAGGGNLDAIPGNIVFDSVINVDVRRFSGHVYSLQTNEKWYVSNGIISHNCMTVPIVEGVDPPNWEKGPDWFMRQPESYQRDLLGPGKYDLWKSGGFDLKQLARHTENDVWGRSPRTATLKELMGGIENKFNGGLPYFRYTQGDKSPMSQWGHAMFADRQDKVSEHFSYGTNAWTFTPGKSGGKTVSIESLRNETIDKLKRIDSDKYPEIAELLREYTPQQIADDFNPIDIVTGAAAYDNGDTMTWFYKEILEPHGIGAVITKDGAIVFDRDMIRRAMKFDWENKISHQKSISVPLGSSEGKKRTRKIHGKNEK